MLAEFGQCGGFGGQEGGGTGQGRREGGPSCGQAGLGSGVQPSRPDPNPCPQPRSPDLGLLDLGLLLAGALAPLFQ